MLGVLLTILKIIGIILLVILLTVLFLLAIVLFVPVRYRLQGSLTEDKRIIGKIHWLFSAVSVPLTIDENGVNYVIKIFGIDISKCKKKRRPKKKKDKKKETNRAEDGEDKRITIQSISENEKESTKKVVDHNTEEIAKEEISQETNWFIKKFTSIFDKIRNKFEKIKNTILEIIKHLQSIWKSCCDLSDKKNKIFDFICEEEAVKEKADVIRVLRILFRHVLPYKLKANIKFGLVSPDQTGIVYGLLCMLYGIYGKNLIIEPDFENVCLEGDFKLKGRIRLIKLVYYVIYLYRIKKLKEFISLLRNL